MKIVESLHWTITAQIRFPRSKKKRIRNKWSKNPKNLITKPDSNCLVMGDIIYCHPLVARELRSKARKDDQQNRVDYIGGNIYGNITPGSFLGHSFYS
jgi:hypothetical protein